MIELHALKQSVLADGVIGEAGVKQFRRVLYADGKIDKEEAEFLFELNDTVSGQVSHSSWETLFVMITNFLLDDKVSHSEIGDEEALWLPGNILKDGLLDKTAGALLDNLESVAKKFLQVLNLK